MARKKNVFFNPGKTTDAIKKASGEEELVNEGLKAWYGKDASRRKTKALNRKQAIRARCIECFDFNHAEVKNCRNQDCPLYNYRSGRGPQDRHAREQAIIQFCSTWCKLNQSGNASSCPSDGCPLYKYRNIQTSKANKSSYEPKNRQKPPEKE